MSRSLPDTLFFPIPLMKSALLLLTILSRESADTCCVSIALYFAPLLSRSLSLSRPARLACIFPLIELVFKTELYANNADSKHFFELLFEVADTMLLGVLNNALFFKLYPGP